MQNHSSLPCQDVAWGAHKRKTKTPVGSRCAACSRLVRDAFGTMGWDTVVTRAAGDEEFMALVQEARENMVAGAAPPRTSFQPENFKQHHDSGYRYEQAFKLIPESEVLEGLSLKDVQRITQIDSFEDLAGQKVRGVLVKDGHPRIVLYRDQSTSHSSLVHQAQQQLRSGQGQDIAEWFRRNQQESGLLPSPMIPKTAVRTEGELWAALKAAREQKLATQEARTVFAEPAPPTTEPCADEVSPSENDDIEQEVQADSPALKMPGVKGKGKGKKGQVKGVKTKQRERAAKAKASPKRLRLTGKRSTQVTASVASQSAMPSEAGSSGASSVAAGSTATGKHGLSPVEKWDKDLSIGRLLSGKLQGLKRHNAFKTLGGLRKAQQAAAVPDPAQDVQVLLLQGHLELFKRAECLLPGQIKKISKTERVSILRELAIGQEEIPPFTACTLAGQATLEDTAAARKVERLTPGVADVPFDPLEPLLSASGVTLQEQARLIQKVLIHETLLQQVCLGEKGVASAQELCREVLKQWCPLHENLGEQDPVLKLAMTELIQVAQFILALVGEDIADAGKVVSVITTANQGIHLVVRQASAFEDSRMREWRSSGLQS